MKKFLWILSLLSAQNSSEATPPYWKMTFFENESRTESSSAIGRITKKQGEVQPVLEELFYDLLYEIKVKQSKFK